MRSAMPHDRQLGASYDHCRHLARRAARNFYYGFKLLPAEKRDALCALYAFMRHADDISDSENEIKDKTNRLKQWREVLDHALAGEHDGKGILPAFHDTVRKYAIRTAYF